MKKDLSISGLNDVYGVLLTPHQREIIRNYYDYDLSLAEIAQNTGVSRQAVRDVIVKAVEQLKFYEDKLGVAAKTRTFEESVLEAILSLEKGDCDGALSILKRLKQKLEG